MCIAIAPMPQSFAKTVEGLFEAETGEHVSFYSNTVGRPRHRPSDLIAAAPRGIAPRQQTRRSGRPSHWKVNEALGNALVIPLLTDDFESIHLLRETADTPNLLRDIRSALTPPRPKTRGGRGVSFGMGADSVKIENFDIYTLVQASRASLIPDAVRLVDSKKRPPLNAKLFEFLESAYDCPFVVACFDPSEGGSSKPIAYRYRPRYADLFMIYTLDSHDGSVPKLDEVVTLDHAVFAGSYRMKGGTPVDYSDKIPASLRPYVPTNVVGRSLDGKKLVNGDIVVSVDDVVAGKFDALRVSPPNVERDPQPLD